MKYLSTIFLTFAICLSLVACGDSATDSKRKLPQATPAGSASVPTVPPSEAAHTHSWKGATYTAPKTCQECGATDGSALEKPNIENYHGHVYTGGEYSKKFHYEEKCPGKNSHEITWDDVERRGLEPCGTCVLK